MPQTHLTTRVNVSLRYMEKQQRAANTGIYMDAQNKDQKDKDQKDKRSNFYMAICGQQRCTFFYFLCFSNVLHDKR